jgi:Pyruvate/2-oxoacid:ferredoxin oxidoreductase delta subunit/coenzyme F420-reducing hydrogenase delta subunit
MLLVLLVTGLYLVFVYRVGSPFASLERIAADPWLGAWLRSLHRYSSDLFVIAAALHAFRMLAQSRSWGPRTLAWISGLCLFALGLVCAWTGFVMAWDSFGQRLALEGARLFDALPIFSEPIRRIFAGDRPVPSAFFFVNLFIHIAVPLGMGVGLWLHVSRLARPALLPPRRLTWAIILALTAASVLLAAPLGQGADPFLLPQTTPINLVVAWWLPLTERVSPGLVWSVILAGGAFAILIPRLARRPREGSWAPSVVDQRLCTGCNQCPQDCPWDAITMVTRQDDRPTLVASVDPTRCVSCGICAGSCPPMGVGPPGRTGRDQMADLRTVLQGAETHPLTAICCSQGPAGHIAALEARGARIHLVTCAGNLHSSVIELCLRSGSTGVLVCTCPPRNCVGREGPKWVDQRLYHDREAELQERVNRRRLRVAVLAAGNLTETLNAFDALARDVAELEPPQVELNPALAVECESVALEEKSAR